MSIRIAPRIPLAVVTLALSIAACGETPYTRIDNAQLLDLQRRGVALYDIRLPQEWRQTGVIPGAKTLTYFDERGRPRPDFLPAFAADVARDEPVILICRSGNRSDKLARELAARGYSRVYDVRRGMLGWQAERRVTVAPTGG